MRPFRAREMLPLRQPKIGMFPDLAAREGQFLGIRHAVDPDRARAQKLATRKAK